jgi:hypothetical protein
MIEQCYVKLKLTDDPLIKTIEQYLYITMFCFYFNKTYIFEIL